jgi:hypothetical protein
VFDKSQIYSQKKPAKSQKSGKKPKPAVILPSQKFVKKSLGKQAAKKVKKNNQRLDTDNMVKLETSPDCRGSEKFENYSRLGQYRSEDFADKMCSDDRNDSFGQRESASSDRDSKRLRNRQGARTNLYLGDGGFDDTQQQTGPIDIYGDLSRSTSAKKMPSFKKKK